jgi:hypothetical protein
MTPPVRARALCRPAPLARSLCRAAAVPRCRVTDKVDETPKKRGAAGGAAAVEGVARARREEEVLTKVLRNPDAKYDTDHALVLVQVRHISRPLARCGGGSC